MDEEESVVASYHWEHNFLVLIVGENFVVAKCQEWQTYLVQGEAIKFVDLEANQYE